MEQSSKENINEKSSDSILPDYFKSTNWRDWCFDDFVRSAERGGGRKGKPMASLKKIYAMELKNKLQSQGLLDGEKVLLLNKIDDLQRKVSEDMQSLNGSLTILGDIKGDVLCNKISSSTANKSEPLSSPQQASQAGRTTPEQQQQQQQARRTEAEIGARLNDKLIESIKSNFPKKNDRLVIGEYDYSEAFYKFQLKVLRMRCPLPLESHLQHILALSSILLVKPNRMHDDLKNVFDGRGDDLVEHLEDLFGNIGKLPWHLIQDVGKILEDVKTKEIAWAEGVVRLMRNHERLSRVELRLSVVVLRLFMNVWSRELSEEIKEQELSSRFVEPLLMGLFEDRDNDVLLRFTGVITVEGKRQLNVTKKRPDITTTLLDELHFGSSLGFGEVKCESECNNNYVNSKDLLRLGIFSKASIDTNDVKGVLSYQIIGRLVVFYVVTLVSDGLYIMYELCRIQIPLTLDDLMRFLLEFDKLELVLRAFNEWCILSSSRVNTSRKRQSMEDRDYDEVVSKVVDRKRECVTKHRQR